MNDINKLLEEVIQPRGCRVKLVTDKAALEFIKKVTLAEHEGKEPNVALAARILLDRWDIKIKRRNLEHHVRGECGCPKK